MGERLTVPGKMPPVEAPRGNWVPEDSSDPNENKYLTLLSCIFPAISGRPPSRYSHRGVTETSPRRRQALQSQGLPDCLGKGRNSHGSDFSLFSARRAGRRRIDLAVGDYLGA